MDATNLPNRQLFIEEQYRSNEGNHIDTLAYFQLGLSSVKDFSGLDVFGEVAVVRF